MGPSLFLAYQVTILFSNIQRGTKMAQVLAFITSDAPVAFTLTMTALALYLLGLYRSVY